MKGQLPEESLDKIPSSTSYRSSHQDDEIDLLQLLVELWSGKKIIIFSVVVFLLIGLTYIVVTNSKPQPSSYVLSVSSKVEVYDSEVFRLCQKERNYIGCLDGQMLSQYSKLLPSWSVNTENSVLSKRVGQENQDLESYQRELDAANTNITQYFLDKTRKSLRVMDSLNSSLQGTEVVAESMLQAKQALSLLEEEGAKVISFGKLSLKKELASTTKTKTPLVIILSAFLGIFFGVLVILLKKVFNELKLRVKDSSIIEK